MAHPSLIVSMSNASEKLLMLFFFLKLGVFIYGTLIDI